MSRLSRFLAGTLVSALCLALPAAARQNGSTAPRPTGSPATVALFAARPASGDAPLTVRFVDRSFGTITSWSWDFGDGTVSHASNPTHIYGEGGVYAVRLTVHGPTGTDTLEKPRAVIARSCAIDSVRENRPAPLERGEDFVPITGDDSLGFYCVYSGKAVGPSNPGISNNVGIFLLPLSNGEVLVFGSGYGDPNSLVTPTQNAAYDARRIDAILRFCLGRLPESTPLRFVAPHGHIDHINADIVREMRKRAYPIREIAFHVGDSSLVKSLPGWTPADRALFRVLRNSTPQCQEELASYASPLGRIWLHLRDGHTAGSIDLVIDVRNDPLNRFVVRGSAGIFGTCPIPNTREAIEPHGNIELRAPPPEVLAIAPGHGSALGGTSVLVSGQGFTANLAGPPTLLIDGAPATSVSVLDDGSLTCVAPAGIPGEIVDIELFNQNGLARLAGGFRYRALPTLVAVTPARGVVLGGTRVTLTGSGFLVDAAGPNTITFGGLPASAVQVIDDHTLVCTAPAGTVGPSAIALSNRNGSALSPGGFLYLPAIDVLALNPASGSALGGSRVQLTGSAFGAGQTTPEVFFGAARATDVVLLSDTRLNCTTPAGSGGAAVDVLVSAENGTDTLAAGFRYFSEPRVTALTPASGPELGGTSVTLTGSNFTRNAPGANSVTIGALPATNVVTLSDTQIRCKVPAGAGGARVDVVVTNGNGTGRLAQGYRYHRAPQLASLAPAFGGHEGGALVTLRGAGFTETDAAPTRIFFGGLAALELTLVDDTTLTCRTPARAGDGTVDVTLVNSNGSALLASAFRFVTRPLLLALEPDRGPAREGATVVLHGAGFRAAGAGPPEIRFGAGLAESVRVLDDSTVTCRAPLGAPGARVGVRLSNQNGGAGLPAAFEYLALPRLTRIDPAAGQPAGGERIALFGGGFLDGATPRVRFGTSPALDVIVLSDERLECTAPPGSGRVDVSLHTAGGAAMLLDGYAYGSPGPVLTSLEPGDGPSPGGEAVVLRGENFLAGQTGAIQVHFGAALADAVVVVGDTRITCLAPPGAPGARVDVSVSNAHGTAISSAAYRYHLRPTLASVTPARGSSQGGTQLMLRGSGFLGDRSGPNAVTIGGAAASEVQVIDDETLACRTPPGPVSGPADVQLANANGKARILDGFTYLDAPTLASLSPPDGSPLGGTLVSLSGTGFLLAGAGTPEVRFGAQPASEVVVRSDTQLTCLSPAGAGGSSVDVRLANGNGVDTLASAFRYRASPLLASVGPLKGPANGGTTVVLNGSGFLSEVDGPNQVLFGGVPASVITTVSNTRVRVTAPPGPPGTSVDVELSNSNGVTLLPLAFGYNALPTLDGFEPAGAPGAGGVTVTLHGSGFQNDGAGLAQVLFGSAPATGVSVLDDTTLTCSAPAGESGGTVVVRLSNGNGSAAAAGSFLYFPAPRIDALLPPHGFSGGGTLLEIRGAGWLTNEAGVPGVFFGDLAAGEISVLDDGILRCRTPAGVVGPVTVRVDNANGSTILPDGFYYDWAPTLTEVQPAQGSSLGGSEVRLTGGGFATVGAGALSVRFGANLANNVRVLDGKTLLCTAPAGPAGATVNVVVWNSRGSSTLNGYRYYPRPNLTSVDPPSGPPEGGTSVTLHGAGFLSSGAGTPSVRFAGVLASGITVVDDSTVRCTSPAGPARTSASITLQNANGSASFVDGFRWFVREPGDLNDDGVADALLGAGEAVTVFFGSPFGLGDESTATADVLLRSSVPGDFGAQVCAGDLNGDQIPDLAVSAPLDDGGGIDIGAVFVFFGPLAASPSARLSSSADAIFRGTNAGDRFGAALSVHDVTGDGLADLVVGAPLDDSAGSDAGAVFVYRGQVGFASRSTAQALVRLTGTGQRQSFGAALASGDATGDGLGDLAVGAPLEGASGGSSGAAYLFRGGPGLVSTSSASALVQLAGTSSGDRFGSSLALGDFDGDGSEDLFVGAPEAKSGGTQGGQIFYFRGGPGLVSGSATGAQARLDAELTGDRLGQVLAVGDADGDGRADLLASAPLHDVPASNGGRAYWVRGGPLVGGTIAQRATMVILSEASVGDQFGSGLAVTDIDADGRGDLLIGAPFSNGGGADSGRVHVFLGAGLQATRSAGADDLTWTGAGAGMTLGRQVGSSR